MRRVANTGLFSMHGWLNQRKCFLIPVAIGVLVAIWISVARIAAHFSGASRGAAESNEARAAMQAIRSAAYHWQVYHGESVCPSIRQLVDGRFLDPNVHKVDPWEQPFVITCMDLGAVVTSFGPDQKKGTPDDIMVASPNSEFWRR